MLGPRRHTGEDNFVPTEKKIAMIDRMAEIGFKRVEVTSFAHPKLVKQFADSIDVLKGITRRKDVTYIAIVPTTRRSTDFSTLATRVTGFQEITAIISASEDHLLANLEKTFAEAMPPLANLVRRARAAGLKVIGCVGTSFGCPLAGEVPIEKVIELTQWYLEQGATSIMPGDTTGEANPLQVGEFYARMRTDSEGRFHFAFPRHSRDGFGKHVRGASGGRRLSRLLVRKRRGPAGHQAAEISQGFFGQHMHRGHGRDDERNGNETGVKTEDVVQTALLAERALGKEANGRLTRSGIVRRRSREVLSGDALRAGMEIPPGILLLTPRR